MSTNEVATTILAQLGGNRFLACTGAKNLTADGSSLIFKLPARFAKDGITAVRITLDPSDTYTMTFFKQHRAPSFRVETVREVEGVYADQLQELFTNTTGLVTRLF